MSKRLPNGMWEIEYETIRDSFKPFDVVTDINGNVGFIQEVSVNDSQPEPKDQISYAVRWLVGIFINQNKHAWFVRGELKKHCNLLVVIAECACHPMGHNSKHVNRLMEHIGTMCIGKDGTDA